MRNSSCLTSPRDTLVSPLLFSRAFCTFSNIAAHLDDGTADPFPALELEAILRALAEECNRGSGDPPPARFWVDGSSTPSQTSEGETRQQQFAFDSEVRVEDRLLTMPRTMISWTTS